MRNLAAIATTFPMHWIGRCGVGSRRWGGGVMWHSRGLFTGNMISLKPRAFASPAKPIRPFSEGGQIARSHFSSELQTQEALNLGFRNAFVNNVLGDAIALYVEGNLKDAERLLDSFHSEAVKSNRRWGWLWLRLRVKIKPLRQLFGHA